MNKKKLLITILSVCLIAMVVFASYYTITSQAPIRSLNKVKRSAKNILDIELDNNLDSLHFNENTYTGMTEDGLSVIVTVKGRRVKEVVCNVPMFNDNKFVNLSDTEDFFFDICDELPANYTESTALNGISYNNKDFVYKEFNSEGYLYKQLKTR